MPSDPNPLSLLVRDWEANPPRNTQDKVSFFFKSVVIDPLIWLRTNVLQSNQKSYNWYHKRYRRVPTIDQCYTYDKLCQWEADQQFRRDMKIDSSIMVLLKERFEDCMLYEGQEREQRCIHLWDAVQENETNWVIKYGDLGLGNSSQSAFLKQKHRMAWERRHGQVGTGMKKKMFRKDGSFYWA